MRVSILGGRTLTNAPSAAGSPTVGDSARTEGGTTSTMHDEFMMTESSYRELQDRLETLKRVKRPEIAEAIRKARSYGDLSENFEYHAARRDQGILNGQIAEMEKQLEKA